LTFGVCLCNKIGLYNTDGFIWGAELGTNPTKCTHPYKLFKQTPTNIVTNS